MIERVVRPDGETRYLSSNGQVLRDESGTPIRMRGTCIDITDQVHAEEQREAAAATLAEARVRRQQALEVNDNVVQGLTAAIYASELGDTDSSRELSRTHAGRRPDDDERLAQSARRQRGSGRATSYAARRPPSITRPRSARRPPAPRPAPAIAC